MIPINLPEVNPEKEEQIKNQAEKEKKEEKEEKNKKEVIICTKEKNKKLHSSKVLKIHNNKTLKSENKYKCRKSNSVKQGAKQLQERKKALQDELKKINNFKKILTKNSKVYARKYGEEILKKIVTFNDNNNVNMYDSMQKANNVNREFISKKNTLINSTFKNLMHCSQKNINVNIINSFQIVKKDKRRNSYVKDNLNSFLKRFEFSKEKNKDNFDEKENSIINIKTTFDKNESNLKKSIVRYSSFNKRKKDLKDKISLKSNMKVSANFEERRFIPNSIQEYHNISLNFIPIMNKRNSNKKEETNKIVFYSILLNDLYSKYMSKNCTYFTKEELEEEKKRFLYQLYYCLGLSKIYILNFKENKFPNLNSEGILSLNNNKINYNKNKNTINKNSSIFSDNSGIKFKTFYETFSNYSQIKISSLERFDNKSYPNIEIVNQYYIFKDKQIGKGGSSVVYLGEDDEKQITYAIKVTDKNLKANPFKHIYDYVKEEVSILKRIHSKYIVTTYEVIESRSRIYIVMEYMSLGSVNKMIEHIDENQIKQYTRNLICAVEHCHKIANIIHKDINVNNLLINKDGVAKLCDFGISAVFEDDNDLLPSKGPSTYTPPEKKYNEQYRGKPADIYLIGLTLFHMVYKMPLFKDFANLTKNDYINIKIPKKDDNNKDINPNLYQLIQSMLSFEPNDRPTINDLKRDPWLTDDMKNPFPDVIKEALFYSLELTKNQIESLKNKESTVEDFKNMKQNDKVEEEETEEEDSEEEEEEEEDDGRIEEKDEKEENEDND